MSALKVHVTICKAKSFVNPRSHQRQREKHTNSTVESRGPQLPTPYFQRVSIAGTLIAATETGKVIAGKI